VNDTLTYPVELRPDDNGTVLVTFPDFEGAHTYGDDEDEAQARAVDALVTVLDEYIRTEREIPNPSTGDHYVAVPALTVTKLLLYIAMRRQRVTKADLAERLGWHKPQVDRLFKLFHQSRLDQLEQAFRALGMRLVVTAEHAGTQLLPCPGRTKPKGRIISVPAKVRSRDFDLSR